MIVGIDPSFTKTGICHLDIKNKRILFKALSPPGTNDGLRATVQRSEYIYNRIVEDITEDTTIIIEEPLTASIKASSLGILAGFLMANMLVEDRMKVIYGIPPYYLASVNRPIAKAQKLNKKKASSFIADKMLTYFKDKGYEVIIHNDKLDKKGNPKKRVLSSDEAEAFLMVIALLRHKNMTQDNLELLGLEDHLIKVNRNILKKDSKITQHK